MVNVTFWGVRGSTPCPCDANKRYGGNTACVSIAAPGQDPILFDLGTGLRFFGESLAPDQVFNGIALVTHLHWDHVQGLPFFTPINRPGASLTVCGRDDEGTLQAAFEDFMRPPYFPVRPTDLCGEITFRDVDTETFKLIANVLVDTRPRAVLYEDGGKRFWVTSEVGGTLSVIDANTYKIVKKIGFAIEGVRDELIQPLGIRFSKDGKRGFVALGRANRIAVIDVERLEVTNYILVGQRPWHMEMSPDGSKLYTANGLTNDLTIIDVATLKAEKSVPVGRLPWGIAIKP